MSFDYSIDLKEAVLELPMDKQFELSLFLLHGVFGYTDMYLSDSDYSQYLRFLPIHQAMTTALPLLDPLDSSALLFNEK